eukprot:54759-Amphidinium_carterae.1
MATAAQIISAKGAKSPEGASLVSTFDYLTLERCIQLGMLADAALECSSIVHCMDQSSLDESELPKNIEHFYEVCKILS